MPKLRKGQSSADFLNTCIPRILKEGKAKTSAQAVAICYSEYKAQKNELDKKIIEGKK